MFALIWLCFEVKQSFITVCGQSKDATCDDYFKEDGFTASSVAPKTEDTTPLIPEQRDCTGNLSPMILFVKNNFFRIVEQNYKAKYTNFFQMMRFSLWAVVSHK